MGSGITAQGLKITSHGIGISSFLKDQGSSSLYHFCGVKDQSFVTPFGIKDQKFEYKMDQR